MIFSRLVAESVVFLPHPRHAFRCRQGVNAPGWALQVPGAEDLHDRAISAYF